MAELTQTRVGEGATVIRAVDGLSQRLRGTPWSVELVEAPLDQLVGTRTPVLTAILTDKPQRHMVTLLAITDSRVLATRTVSPQMVPSHAVRLFVSSRHQARTAVAISRTTNLHTDEFDFDERQARIWLTASNDDTARNPPKVLARANRPSGS